MAFDAVLARFVAKCPVAVMARLALQRAVSAEWVDSVFEAHRERQYTRELLFSTVVDLMTLVALGLRPSPHAAAQRAIADGELHVSLAALYEKVNHAEPAVLRALVRGSAEHLPGTEHRLAPLRGVRAACARRRCRGSRSWSTIPRRIWSSTWCRGRTPTPASAC